MVECYLCEANGAANFCSLVPFGLSADEPGEIVRVCDDCLEQFHEDEIEEVW